MFSFLNYYSTQLEKCFNFSNIIRQCNARNVYYLIWRKTLLYFPRKACFYFWTLMRHYVKHVFIPVLLFNTTQNRFLFLNYYTTRRKTCFYFCTITTRNAFSFSTSVSSIRRNISKFAHRDKGLLCRSRSMEFFSWSTTLAVRTTP